jgi:hypothetical protein
MKTTRIVLVTMATLVFAAMRVGPSWAQDTQQTPAPAPAGQPAAAAAPAAASSSAQKTYSLEVSGQKEWMDSGIDLREIGRAHV